jgi:mRNA interferase RelE/StbE
MAYRLLYLPGAEKDIQALPGSVLGRVRRGLERLAESPRLGKPLHGELVPFWSYRVSDYRVVYEIRDEELLVVVVMLGHRRKIYERARRKRR